MTNTKKQYTTEEMESKYNDITVLFDYAEELVATVESQFVQDPEAQMALVEPLINDIGDATDVLSEEFITIAESKRGKAVKASKSRIEAALRKIFVSVTDYQAKVKATSKSATSALKNIADPIVAKIQRQVEQVVAVFLEFVNISLYSIMNKAEVEALRVRDTRIAMMMHQQAMSQQQ
jgi:hypothetical protein